MKDTRAIGLIGSMCVRMMGLLVVVAGYVVPRNHTAQRRFVKAQRDWLDEQQSLLELEEMVNEAMVGGDAE